MTADDLVFEAAAIRALSADVLDATDIGTHAVEYAIHNWAVIPLCDKETDPVTKRVKILGPHGKEPATRHGLLDATTDIGAVICWWGGKFAGYNIGLRPPSTVMVLDIDPRHGGDDTWEALQRQHGQVPHCLTTLTGGADGGRHLYMRRPPKRLSDAKLRGRGIDLRTSSNYVVAAPSIHPDTGKPYVRVDGPIIEPPRWLVDLLTVEPPPPPKPSNRRHRLDGPSVIDTYNAAASWADVLMPHGWACLDADPDADGARWLHPTATSKCSATIKGGRLYCYSTSTVLDVTEAGNPQGYSKFDALSALEHNRDWKVTVQHLVAQGGQE